MADGHLIAQGADGTLLATVTGSVHDHTQRLNGMTTDPAMVFP